MVREHESSRLQKFDFIHSTVDQAAIIAKHLEQKYFFTKGEILSEL
jgi:hypothetical protein